MLGHGRLWRVGIARDHMMVENVRIDSHRADIAGVYRDMMFIPEGQGDHGGLAGIHARPTNAEMKILRRGGIRRKHSREQIVGIAAIADLEGSSTDRHRLGDGWDRKFRQPLTVWA